MSFIVLALLVSILTTRAQGVNPSPPTASDIPATSFAPAPTTVPSSFMTETSVSFETTTANPTKTIGAVGVSTLQSSIPGTGSTETSTSSAIIPARTSPTSAISTATNEPTLQTTSSVPPGTTAASDTTTFKTATTPELKSPHQETTTTTTAATTTATTTTATTTSATTTTVQANSDTTASTKTTVTTTTTANSETVVSSSASHLTTATSTQSTTIPYEPEVNVTFNLVLSSFNNPSKTITSDPNFVANLSMWIANATGEAVSSLLVTHDVVVLMTDSIAVSRLQSFILSGTFSFSYNNHLFPVDPASFQIVSSFATVATPSTSNSTSSASYTSTYIILGAVSGCVAVIVIFIVVFNRRYQKRHPANFMRRVSIGGIDLRILDPPPEYVMQSTPTLPTINTVTNTTPRLSQIDYSPVTLYVDVGENHTASTVV